MIYEVRVDKKVPVYENHLSLGGKNDVEEIRLNSRYLLKNGKPWIPIMGEIHYSRLEEHEWENEIAKMKAGGITVVSCYVIWIYHEEKEGKFNFSGNRNLRKFIEICARQDMKVVLRIGPWVHGEVRNGGFPDWLLNKSCALRCNDADYLVYVKKYYQEIQKQVKGLLFYDNGPIWAIQLENELTNQGEHLLTLRHMAEEIGLNVPVYTVTGWNAKYGAEIPEYDVLPVFGGYPEAPWECHKEKLMPSSNYFFIEARNDSAIGNDLLSDEKEDDMEVFHMRYELYPFATCELGGGVQVTHHRRPVMGADDVAALSLVKLGCGNNMPGYYMYHGGTNDISETTLQESRKTGYPNDYPIRNYDFQAPIGQYGQIRDSYRQLKKQNMFVQSFMEELACMDAYFQIPAIAERMDKKSLRYSVRTNGTSGFVFVNNFQRLDKLKKHEDVQFAVPCEDGKMIFPKKGMDIFSGVYFILPYNMDLGEMKLKYATVQPLYKKASAWYFMEIEGIKPEYCICDKENQERSIFPEIGKDKPCVLKDAQGDVTLVLLSAKEADFFYVLDNEVYITEEEDIYKKQGRIVSCSKGTHIRDIEYKEFQPELSEYSYATELFLEEEKAVKGYYFDLLPEMKGDKETGFLEISYVGDVLQIYADGVLAADEFCVGAPFEVKVSALLKYGRKIEILISEMKETTCYKEAGSDGLELKKIHWIY